jgi:hypothetical protein
MSQIAMSSHPGSVAPPPVVRNNRAVPTGLVRLIAFVHPVIALASLALMGWVASLGLRCRERSGAHLRGLHRRIAPYAYALMLVNFGLGCWSTVQLRPDLELAAGMHFRLGLAIAVLFTAVAMLSRRIGGSDTARFLHPALGLTALLLAALQVFFGMAMLPL